MALGAVLAAALTDHSAHVYGLFVGGVDVIKEPVAASRYATPIDSVLIEEQGPDDVSSMEFVIECTTALPVSIGEGMDVIFDRLTDGYRFFRGWVDHVDIENMDGNVGTRFAVRCTGIEAALDWCVMPADVTIAAGTDPGSAVQTLAAQAAGTVLGVLNVAGDGTQASSQAFPVATGWTGFSLTANAVTISAGTTLREAIRQVTAQVIPAFGGERATVDFFGGLRYYQTSPGDSFTLSIVDNPPIGANTPAENLQYGIDAVQVRQVVVRGTGVTVLVSDGTARAGPTAVLVDATLTTTAAAQQAGAGYLKQYASSVRGRLELTDFDLPAFGSSAHAFQMSTNITDARVNSTNIVGAVTTIAKSFANSERQNLVISFGGPAPSMAGLARQLTRNVLS